MLRVHFTAEDLGRVRLAPRSDALWETALSLHQLARPHFYFSAWTRRARSAVARDGMGTEVRLLSSLVPPTGYFPDFLTPAAAGTVTDLETGIDAVLSTGRRRLRTDIAHLAGEVARPAACLDDIARGRAPALRRLGTALRRYHHAVLTPHDTESATRVAADRDHRARRVLKYGSEALLAHLGPALRWRPPVLEADYPVERDLHLGGRGLTVIPSLFAIDMPVTLADTGLQPVLVYPVARDPLWLPGTAASRTATALADLLGSTRAAALCHLDTAHTTTSLAARLATSASTASRHAAALRRAGLVTTERTGSHVLHARTLLGTALVHGG